ncbi:MAG: hypothetical protein EPN93_10650 [Spirochaetes bacterium]|nr:MAG: hypothetical protein EPN93_10650 [Spirochaetota bacterium]
MKKWGLAAIFLAIAALTACDRFGNPLDHNNLGIAISPRTGTIVQSGNLLFSTTGGTLPYSYTVVSGSGSITANGLYVNASATAPDTAVIRVKDAAGNSDEATITVGSYEDYLLSIPGLEGMWRMTDPNWDYDETTNYNLTAFAVPISQDAVDQPISATQDPINTAADFSGGGYVTITNSRGFDPAGDYTVMAWIKTASLASATPVVAFSQADPTTGQETAYIAVRSDSTDTIGCWYWDTGLGSTWIDSGVYAAPGQWYHVALVKSGTTVNLYVDAILKKQTTTANFNSSPLTDLAIGGLIDNTSVVTDNFNGSIDEVLIYTRPLDAAEIGDYVMKTKGMTLILDPAALTMALRGEQSFTVTGGVAPYTYSITAGAGTVNAAGQYENTSAAPEMVTVHVVDSQGRSADATINVVYYSDYILATPGLEGFWRLESATLMTDSALHYGNNTSSSFPTTDVAGPIAIVQEPVTEAAVFNGSLSQIIIDNSVRLFNPAAGDFTVMAWIKPASLVAASNEPMIIFSQADSLTDGLESAFIAVRTDTTDTIGCWYYDSISLGRVWIDSGAYATVNQWHHAALVKSGTTASLYVDGVLAKTAPMNLGPTTGDMAIGGKIDSPAGGVSVTQLFNGSIDEAILYTRALSANDIATYFKSTQGTKLILYPRIITLAPEGQQIFKVAGGIAPYLYSVTGTGTMNYNSVNGLYKNAAAPESVTVTVTDSVGHSDSTTIDVISYTQSMQNVSELLGYWQLESGSLTADKVGNFTAATPGGPFTFGPGAIQIDASSEAANFDGIASNIVIDNVPAPPPVTVFDPTLDFTVAAWFRVNDEKALATSGSNARVVFSLADDAGFNDIAFIGINSAGTDSIGSWIGGSWIDSTVPVVPGPNNWYHVVVTKSGTEVKIYVNGYLKKTQGSVTVLPAVGNLAIGGMITDNTPTLIDYFEGDIDDVALYNRALSDDEVAARYLTSKGLKIGLSPAATIVPYLGTRTFQGFGGTAPYTYSIVPNPAEIPTMDGTINASGLYTAPDDAAHAFETDTIRVTDADGYTAEATVLSVFSPGQLTGLIQWLNAGFMTPGYADSNPVALWLDLSSMGNSAVSVGATQPIYRTNAINGKPALEFNGTAHYMTVANSFANTYFAPSGNNFTFIIVFKPNSTAVQSAYSIGSFSSGREIIPLGLQPGSPIDAFVSRYDGTSESVTYGTSFTAADWNFAAQVFYGTPVSTTSLYLNNTNDPVLTALPSGQLFATVPTLPFIGTDLTYIGARDNGAPFEFFNGYIAEIIVYDHDLDETTELIRVYDYVREKYGF